MDGFETFETWDETYVHDLHNEDRTVLMERVEGDHREPWTWVREYGKGRVFTPPTVMMKGPGTTPDSTT